MNLQRRLLLSVMLHFAMWDFEGFLVVIGIRVVSLVWVENDYEEVC